MSVWRAQSDSSGCHSPSLKRMFQRAACCRFRRDLPFQLHVPISGSRMCAKETLMSNLKSCIVTGDPISPVNDSKAHVIPSALGGRLKPKGILTVEGNGILDDKFDYPLTESFQAIMNLIGGS